MSGVVLTSVVRERRRGCSAVCVDARVGHGGSVRGLLRGVVRDDRIGGVEHVERGVLGRDNSVVACVEEGGEKDEFTHGLRTIHRPAASV